ncbi:aldolase [Nanoarchaeota archaeon]
MTKTTEKDIVVPADVPEDKKQEYISNYLNATRNTGNLMLFAGDQKIEHLNKDFYGEGISEDDADPEHLFKIASQSTIGVFASQLGMIARYGSKYKDIQYIVKINSKSNLSKEDDPNSSSLVDLDDIIKLKENGIKILGVGFTVYVGSKYENEMLAAAGRLATRAHQNGLLAIFWMYPRGKSVSDEKDPNVVAGAAGVGCCLGADFVKVNYPKVKSGSQADALKIAVNAAGLTKVITAGGSSKPIKEFLQETWDQINVAGAKGNATGRNIHQKDLDQATNMCNAISAITLGGKDVDFANKVFEGKEKFDL